MLDTGKTLSENEKRRNGIGPEQYDDEASDTT